MENKIKIILNPFVILIAIVKMIIVLLIIHYFSTVYNGWIINFFGIISIFWIFEGMVNEWNMYEIKKYLEDLEDEDE